MDNYLRLLEKIDAAVAAIRGRHPGSFECGRGCAECCVSGITVWRVEFDHIQKHLSRSSRPERKLSTDACPFLNSDKLCAIYDARPVVCRLWGAPLLFPSGPQEAMPGILSQRAAVKKGTLTCCEKNFRKGIQLGELKGEDLIDIATVLSTLAAVNHVYCKSRKLDSEERFSL